VFVNSVFEQPAYVSLQSSMGRFSDDFQQVTVKTVTHVIDEWEDEQWVELDNGICFIAKWYEGLFYKGQIVGYQLNTGDSVCIAREGSSGQVFYNTWIRSQFLG